MINLLNAVAVTLLIGVASVLPAAMIGRYLPGVFDPGLRPIAVAAWVSGLIAWFVSRHVTRQEQDVATEASRQQSNSRGVAVTVGFLALAVGIAVALHFFGENLVSLVR